MTEQRNLVLPKEAVDLALDSIVDVLGKKGILSVIRRAGQEEFVVDGKVEEDKQITFDHFGKVTETFIDIFGDRGAGALMRSMGRNQFKMLNDANPNILGATAVAMRELPPVKRIKTTLGVIKLAVKKMMDIETHILEEDGAVLFATEECPYCSGITADHPSCITAVGVLDELSVWATSEQWDVKEIACRVEGSPACVFRISPPLKEKSAW